MPSVQLADALQKLLVSLAQGRPEESVPNKLLVTQFIWGEHDFSHQAIDLALNDARLTVSCSADRIREVVREVPPVTKSQLGVLPIHGKTENDLRFSAEFGACSGDRSSVCYLSAFNWQLCPESRTPSLWFARLEGQLDHLFGNLRVAFKPSPGSLSTTTGLRLEGAYAYYLLARHTNGGRNGQAWFLVLDTNGSGAPSPQTLWCDFLALQFTLGRQLKIGPYFFGVDVSGTVVAWASSAHGADRAGCQVAPPIPPVAITTSTWTVPFFSAISDLVRNRKELRPGIALLSYLDSLTDNVDAAFIRLAVGLEGFSYWLLSGRPDEIIVTNKNAWLAWVREHRNEIRGFATDEKLANSLYGKIEGAFKRASGKVVQDAFNSLGLRPTTEMDEILNLRDYAIHRGVMLKEEQTYDLDRESANIGKARVMLVALVARAAGYRGAIVGWGHHDDQYPELNGFWCVDEPCIERTVFSATEVDASASRVVAPSVAAPGLPHASAT